jgi:hypothetical protein
MRYLIIMSMLMLTACTNGARDAQNIRNDENPYLHTVGFFVGDKFQVGYAEINLD